MLTGYSDRLSVRPGDAVTFMVSTDAPRFRADLVRLIQGDSDPRGPGRKETVVASVFSGAYDGHLQNLPCGSFVRMPAEPHLSLSGDLTIFLWVWPTLVHRARQVLFSNAGSHGRGLVLALAEDGRLSLDIGADTYACRDALLERRWQWIAVTIDCRKRNVRIRRGGRVCDLDAGNSEDAEFPLRNPPVASDAGICLAASGREGGGAHVFNGKIAAPSLFSRCLDDREIGRLSQPDALPWQVEACLAAWDFSLEAGTDKVVDLGPHRCHGRTVQRPVRAMTGPHWAGDVGPPGGHSARHDAIHFHEDSLDDAGWTPSFVFHVPHDLPSGVYAARIETDAAKDYLPFFVSPPRGQRASDIVLVLPTFTYLAYGNELYREFGLNSCYDRYVDGAGVPFGSLRIPMQSFRPDRGIWINPEGKNFGRHLCADLYIIDWLTSLGKPHDILTDHDLHAEGLDALNGYRAVITGSHPEYVSGQILDAFEGYLRAGGKLMYLGGNGFYCTTSLRSDGASIEVRRPNGSRPWSSEPGEDRHETTGEQGGLWRFHGRPPQRLTGVGFTAQGWKADNTCGAGRPYTVTEGTDNPIRSELLAGMAPGSAIGAFESLTLGIGAASDEIDRADTLLGTPVQAVILATASGFSTDYQHVIEERNEVNDATTVQNDAVVRADIVAFETSAGGRVFSVGSIGWSSCLAHDGYDNSVSHLTRRALDWLLGDGGPDRTKQRSAQASDPHDP